MEELLDHGKSGRKAEDGMSPLCLAVREGHDDRVSADSDAKAWGNSRLAKKKKKTGEIVLARIDRPRLDWGRQQRE